MIAVILLAAGASKRFGGARSKLFEPLGASRTIDHTILNLKRAVPKAQIFLVSTPEFRDEAELDLPWVEGGARRQDSARNGIMNVDADVYLVHDAARPFVSAELVERLMAGLERFDGVAPGLPVTDTLKRVEGERIVDTIARSECRSVQTPQALRGNQARNAFKNPITDVEFTDDLAVLAAAGYTTGIVDGDPRNIKITMPSDILRAESILDEFSRRSS